MLCRNALKKSRFFISTAFAVSALIMSLILPSSAFSQAYALNSNTSSGYGLISSEDISQARQKAIDDALRNSVEKDIKKIVGVETYGMLKPLFKESILINYMQFIESYRILDEKQSDYAYIVTAETHIAEKALADKINSFGILLKEKSPRALIMTVQKEKNNHTLYWWSGRADSLGMMDRLIGEYLSETGFSVIDPFAPPIRDVPVVLRTSYLDKSDLERFGELYDADIIIYSEMGKERSSFSLFFLQKDNNAIHLKLKGFFLNEPQTVLSDSYKVELTESIKDSPLLYDMLSWNIPRKTIPKLIYATREKDNHINTAEFIFIGAERYKEYKVIKEMIANMDEVVEELNIKSFARERFIMEVKIKGDISMLLDDLHDIEWPGFGLKLSYLSKNTIIFKIIH